MLFLYRILWVFFLPLIHLFMLIRIWRGKEDRGRVKEKFAVPSVKRPNGKVIWIHAASVGESLLAIEFIKRFQKFISNDFKFLLTTGTVSSANIVKLKGVDNVIHQFAPLDYQLYVKRFLEYWHPDSVFFVESEIWPNMIFNITCPLFLLNARLTEKSFRRWKIFYSFFSSILSKFSIIFAQSKYDADRFGLFSKGNILCTGNIKCSSEKLSINEKLFKIYQTNRPSFTAASTHQGEEKIILDAFKNIKNKFNNAVLFLVPRHPDRSESICNLIKKNNFNYILRSEINFQKLPEEVDVICVNSFGELGTFFKLAHFVFLGGSLVDIGGHNICEPIALKCPVMFGPYMYNFKEIKKYFINFGVAYEVKSSNDISELFCKIIEDKKFLEKIQRGFEEINVSDPIKIICDELVKFF